MIFGANKVFVTSLDIQQSMFKFITKFNALNAMTKPTNLNLFTLFWHILSTNKSVFLDIAMVQVLGSMEDEHFFKFLAFCKSK
jgi:hypothetical protein